ncbi:MAG: ketoacyl-ACP synthase III [Caldiserica bacterium]|nr:ketoacyl-ACP synthase III [Caldisericota bacterium]
MTNEQLCAENPEWDMTKITGRSGVYSRHIAAVNETALDLAVVACRHLLSKNPDLLTTVDGLIMCTESEDYPLPPDGCVLHGLLGLREECFVTDINLACSGFVYGLALARGLVATGMCHNILLVTADTYSKKINPRDRSCRVLFGDGAAVTWLSDASGSGHVVDVLCATDGTGYDKFIVPAGGDRMRISADTAVEHEDDNGNWRSQQDIHMDGLGILTFATAKVPQQVKELLKRNQLTVSDIDLFLFHQASAVVLDSLTRLLRIPPGKVFTNLEQLGNTVSSSIPLALSDALGAHLIKPRSRILISGFGVGLSWASAILEM